jgi:glycerol-3-phosphate cytidylyltransferase
METYMKEQLIGYTTGVFDMFHIGHLNILKNAKSRCDHLIVGVSTDELVKQYKNKKPIIPFEERIEIVKAIKYVDEVVPQISMDKRQAWENLHYNVLFHGSDWKGSAMYDKVIRDLEEVGVKVVFLPHTQGVSSTLLADVLYKQQAEELH